jgi:hypothetical protein
MQYRFHGYRRTSHEYVDAYRHLDSREYIGEYAALKFGEVVYDNKYNDSAHQYVTLKAPKGATWQDVCESAQNHFAQHCRCEHDCCGHWQSSVYGVRHTKRREWSVKISMYQNV